ncbi:MAG: hypothetical protein AAGI71_04215 [Bacteroidota bacterium]
MLIGILLCLLLLAVLHLTTSFWGWILIVPFAYTVVREHRVGRGLAIGAASGGLLWLGMALYLLMGDAALVTDRVAAMAGVETPAVLAAVTGVIGLLGAGLSGGAGAAVRSALTHRRRSRR